MSSRIGVDIGGTFTDVVLINDGKLYRGKSDTTHYDLKIGFKSLKNWTRNGTLPAISSGKQATCERFQNGE